MNRMHETLNVLSLVKRLKRQPDAHKKPALAVGGSGDVLTGCQKNRTH